MSSGVVCGSGFAGESPSAPVVPRSAGESPWPTGGRDTLVSVASSPSVMEPCWIVGHPSSLLRPVLIVLMGSNGKVTMSLFIRDAREGRKSK